METPKTTIKNWDEVNDKLKFIAESTSKRDELNAKQNDEVLKVQGKYKDTLEGLNKDLTEAEGDLTAFVILHEGDFKDSKTKVFDYGEISIRKGSGSLVPKEGLSEEKVISNIKKIYNKKAAQFLKLTESINKAVLNTLKPAELKKLGLMLLTKTNIHIKVKKIETKANKKAA